MKDRRRSVRPHLRSAADVVVSAILLVVAGCGGGAASGGGGAASGPPPLAETCRLNLAPRAPLAAPPPPAPIVPGTPGLSAALSLGPIESRSSRLVAKVDLKLASLAKELEAKVAPRLADERNRDIGIGGHLNYTADRGPFTLSVEGDALVIRTDVRAHAEACRGSSCYASCDPEGKATAKVPLRLGPDYRFAPSRVSFAFTRGCEVRVGGIVKVDVTPKIQSELAPALRNVEQQIDQRLPPMRPQAERLWAELNKTRQLPLGACLVANPRGIAQGTIAGAADAARVSFGLTAYPEIRTRCGDLPAVRPLPPLTQQPAMPEVDDLLVGLVSPLASFASAFEASAPFDAGGARARSARIVAVPSGGLAQLDVSLRGEACGDVGVRSAFLWAEDGRGIRPANLSFVPGEGERTTGAGLVPAGLLAGLGTLRAPPPVPPESLKEVVPSIAQSLSDGTTDVSATVSDVKPALVVVRGEDLVALVNLRGAVQIRQK